MLGPTIACSYLGFARLTSWRSSQVEVVNDICYVCNCILLRRALLIFSLLGLDLERGLRSLVICSWMRFTSLGGYPRINQRLSKIYRFQFQMCASFGLNWMKLSLTIFLLKTNLLFTIAHFSFWWFFCHFRMRRRLLRESQVLLFIIVRYWGRRRVLWLIKLLTETHC
jgi:hypothetical protein